MPAYHVAALCLPAARCTPRPIAFRVSTSLVLVSAPFWPLVPYRPRPAVPPPLPMRDGGAGVQPWSERSPLSRKELEGQTRQ